MAERLETGNSLGCALLEALGIDVKNVMGITIDCNSNEMAVVSVRRSILSVAGNGVAKVLEKYDVTLKSDPRSPVAGEVIVPIETLTETGIELAPSRELIALEHVARVLRRIEKLLAESVSDRPGPGL